MFFFTRSLIYFYYFFLTCCSPTPLPPLHPQPGRSEDVIVGVVVGFACLKCHALFKGKLSVVLFTNIVFLSFAYLAVAARPPLFYPSFCCGTAKRQTRSLCLPRLDTMELGKANGPKRITPLVAERGRWWRATVGTGAC